MNAPTRIRPSDIAELRAGRDTIDAGPRVGRTMRVGYAALGAFLLIFTAWAALAPIDSAAVAPGLLRADGGGRRTVQHLEGGIVSKILVRDGALVRAGQPRLLLDDTQTAAQDAALQANYDSLLAQDARLSAERSGAGSVSYPAELTSRANEPEVRSIIAASNAVFQAKRAATARQVGIVRQRIGQASAELGSASAQLGPLDDQAALLREETAKVQSLVNEGLERESRLLALKRQAANVAGQRSQVVGGADRVRDVIAENQAQIEFLRGQVGSDAALEQRAVRAELEEARQKLSIGRDVNERRQVVAPVSGRVVNLRIVTPGGVVTAGQPILDIVPVDEPIVIAARLKATDIDSVWPGLEAEVRLTPYKARVMPMLKGTVREVAADATYDEKTNAFYYEAQIVLDPKQMKELHDVKLISGMPAEVFVKLGSRSLFRYLMQPLTDSFRRAFREP